MIGALISREVRRGLHGSAEFRNAFNKEPDPAKAQAMLHDFYAPWLSKAAA